VSDDDDDPAPVTFFVSGLAETKGSWIPIAAGRLKPDNAREKPWAVTVGWWARMAMRGRRILFVRVHVELYVTLPVPPNKTKKHKRDGDKLARSCLDAMSGIVYVDDELVDGIVVHKRTHPDPKTHGVRIVVTKHVCPDAARFL